MGRKSGVNKRITRSETKKANKLNKQATTKESRRESKMAEAPKIEFLISHLPSFDGKLENNIEFYINQFDELAEQANIDSAVRLILLKAKLAGSAREKLINQPELNGEKGYEEFKTKLKNEFKPRISFEEAQNKFMRIKQEPEQKIAEFVQKFNTAASTYMKQSGHENKDGAKEFLNTVKLTRFLEAVHPDMAFEIRKNGPKNFDEAVQIAKRIEIAFENSNKDEINTIETTKTADLCADLIKLNTSQNQEIELLKQQLNSLHLQEKQKTQQTTRYCAICEVKTHDTAVCWYNTKNKDNNRQYRNSNYRPARNYINRHPQSQPFQQYASSQWFEPPHYGASAAYHYVPDINRQNFPQFQGPETRNNYAIDYQTQQKEKQFPRNESNNQNRNRQTGKNSARSNNDNKHSNRNNRTEN